MIAVLELQTVPQIVDSIGPLFMQVHGAVIRDVNLAVGSSTLGDPKTHNQNWNREDTEHITRIGTERTQNTSPELEQGGRRTHHQNWNREDTEHITRTGTERTQDLSP